MKRTIATDFGDLELLTTMKTDNPRATWVTYTVTIDFTAPNDATARLITLAIAKVVTVNSIAGPDASVHGPEPLVDPELTARSSFNNPNT